MRKMKAAMVVATSTTTPWQERGWEVLTEAFLHHPVTLPALPMLPGTLSMPHKMLVLAIPIWDECDDINSSKRC